MMGYEIGDKIGAHVCGALYVGVIDSITTDWYYIGIEGYKNGFALNKNDDKIKPVCKSSSISYMNRPLTKRLKGI